MCLLTMLPAGRQPDLDALYHGACLNDDGHGFAVVAGRRLEVGHGLHAETVIDQFAAARARHGGGPALFHSRLATHGSVTRGNCHPVRLGADRRTVLAHNGILPRAVQPAGRDTRSDTRILADRATAMFGPLHSRGARRRMERWVGPDNKIAILTVNPRYTHQAYLLNEHAGVWDGGIWYSNTDYLPPARHQLVGRLARCWQCTAVLSALDAYCPVCGWCPDCGQPEGDCLCYQPRLDPQTWPGRAVLGQHT